MPILTVGDMKYFLLINGIVNFKNEKKKVRLKINVTAAQHAGLEICLKLIMLSKIKERQRLCGNFEILP